MFGSGNWGRWGDGDERGALNLLTPEAVLAAVSCVRDGRVLSLSLPIRGSTSSPAPTTVPHLRGRPLPQHFMSVDGGDYAAGARAIGAGLKMADDALIVTPHGTTTHMDALCHMWAGEELYNGHPAGRVRSYGAARCGIDKAGPVVARGVLFDVAAVRGVPRLAAGDRIDGADLAACGVEVRPGDVAVVRTGWPLTWHSDGPEAYWAGQPGLSADGGRWLAERDVAMVASDNAAIGALNSDQLADEDLADDLHLILLWRHGIHLAEMLWLEDLAEALRADTGSSAAADGTGTGPSVTPRTDFLFVAAPLAIEGGTASPINPMAVL
ncbi:cyclase family protein [Actinomadura sp. HBU206391]|uniref:cyclase family protein n=1 Tax=Actinomadura sp. HBU206391 TaxID=2731692 RepID=UPI00164FDB04|nr:cyclase family protein [Actinomadura sp. HBU206391]MBC6461236.1 cyclase family protein [Actinomadura sp. HBU206391]